MCVFCRFNTLFRSSSFFRKLSSLEVHPCEVPIVVLVSCLSIAMGASVGPEAALGWMGCALAQCFMTTVDHGADHLHCLLLSQMIFVQHHRLRPTHFASGLSVCPIRTVLETSFEHVTP